MLGKLEMSTPSRPVKAIISTLPYVHVLCIMKYVDPYAKYWMLNFSIASLEIRRAPLIPVVILNLAAQARGIHRYPLRAVLVRCQVTMDIK